jgi:hypothetical protein
MSPETTVQKSNSRFVPLYQIGAVCLLWIAVAISLPHTNASLRRMSQDLASNPYTGARFVIADLDGDEKPDLALVELQALRSANANYSIRVKLSQGQESAIGVNGPLGGLKVVARDVNGDDNVDLVVTSNLDGQFVEVLLNDGQGNFSAAAPGEFLQPNDSNAGSVGTALVNHAELATLVSARSSQDEAAVLEDSFQEAIPTDFYFPASLGCSARRVSVLRQGRSPPTPFSLS